MRQVIRTERLQATVEERIFTQVNQDALPETRIERKQIISDNVYVLASLDRVAWVSGLRQRMAEVDRDLVAARKEHERAVAEGREGPLAVAMRLYRTVIPLAAERKTIERRLQLCCTPRKSTPNSVKYESSTRLFSQFSQ